MPTTRLALILVLTVLGLGACSGRSPVLHHFVIEAVSGGNIGNQATDVPFNIKITAQDSSNKTLTSFSGKVNITSTGTLVAGGGTTAAFVNGVLASHLVTISSQGGFTLTATRVGGSESGTSRAFTVDGAPLVTSTSPEGEATGVSPSSSITLNFSEEVEASPNSFALECPAGATKSFALSASPASSFTLTPSSNLPSATTCEVKVIAAQISDADANDPPNNLAADHTFSFSTSAVSTATSTITANPTSIVANGIATSSISVQLKDVGGNNLSSSGGSVTLSTTAGILSAVSDNNDGSYSATLTAPSTPGSALVSGTLNGETLSDTATVNFVAGPLHHFAIEAQGGGNIPGQITHTPFNIRITAQDANNHTVSGFSGTVNITSTGTLSAGAGTTAAFVNGVLASHSVMISNQGTFTLTATRTSGSEAGTSNPFAVLTFNQAPSFSKGPNQTVLEDAAAQSVAGWATAINDGDANTTQALTFVITGNTNAALFSAGPAVSANGTLSYTPAPNANGTATITLVLKDDGGTANGGTDTSPPQTFSISVSAVNDAPSFSKGPNQTVLEDAGAQTVGGWASAISKGPANESSQSVSFMVSNNNTALFSAQPAVSAAGVLTYTPAANQNGSATVSVQIKDNGGTASGGVDTSAVQTFTISVTAVNDPPSFSKGANQTLNEDAGAQTVNNWATAISRGPSNESGQSVSFIVSNNNTALFSAQPVVSAAGVLTYTPAANQNGSATVSVQIKDSGGTASGGVDTSAVQTFSITVNSVNDAPSFTKGDDQVVTDDAGLQTINGWASLISAGPPDEAGQTLNFNITGNTNPALFSDGPAVSSAGVLTFTPAPGADGIATITLTLSDSGGTANGGQNTSAPQSFSIQVTANGIPILPKKFGQTIKPQAETPR